jgi:hypothetical protein
MVLGSRAQDLRDEPVDFRRHAVFFQSLADAPARPHEVLATHKLSRGRYLFRTLTTVADSENESC